MSIIRTFCAWQPVGVIAEVSSNSVQIWQIPLASLIKHVPATANPAADCLEPGLLERISAHYVEEISKTLSHA